MKENMKEESNPAAFFKGNKVEVTANSFKSEPTTGAKVVTGDNESKTSGIDNLAAGTNPVLQTGNNTAQAGVINTAFDIGAPPHVTDFLTMRGKK